MKIAQYKHKGQIGVGIVSGEMITPLDCRGNMLSYILEPLSCRPGDETIPIRDIRFAPPVSNPSKIIAIGLNYLDHVRESKGKIPELPMVFAKFPNSLVGHGDLITWSTEITNKVDFEAELAVVVGKETYGCDAEEAMDCIFGYTCANDVSARDLQFGDGQWVRGKSLDSFCPLGPWIVTADDIPDPNQLDIRCLLNGTPMQESNTSLMIFKIPQLISFLSRHFTLNPGDIILTGTPHGVGAFRDPSIYLTDGDEIAVEISGIGKLINICRVR